MRNKVRLKKGQLDHFRRLSRDSKNEIQAFLVGEVLGPHSVRIDSFAYPPRYADQSPSHVQWYTIDFEKVRLDAEERGLSIIGFIHSHPEWDAVLSGTDYNICIRDMHRICGIVSTQGRKTRARFWSMDSALPYEIIYEKKKGTPADSDEDSE